MKRRFAIVVLMLAVIGGFLGLWWTRSTKAQGNSEIKLQGRTTLEWLSQVEIGPDEPNSALEVLASAGPKVISELSRVLLAPDSFKDLSLRLPNAVMPLDKKRARADESEILSLKAKAAFVLGVVLYRNPGAPEVKESVAALTCGLRSGSPPVRWLSAQALGAAGKVASNAVPALIVCVSDDDTSLRICAVEAIGRIGLNTPDAFAAVNRALSDTNGDVVAMARLTLLALQEKSPGGETRK